MKNINELNVRVYEDSTDIGTTSIEAGQSSFHIRNGWGDGDFELIVTDEFIDFEDYGFQYSASFDGIGVIKDVVSSDNKVVNVELDGFYMLYTGTEYADQQQHGAVAITRLRDSE